MVRHLAASVAASVAALAFVAAESPARAAPRFDHVYVVMMENQSFDNLVGRNKVDASGNILGPDTPFITSLSTQHAGIATLYFGVTHPSLPNYLTTVSGDYFGIQDDNPSCAAQPPPGSGCHIVNATNIVDSLEKAGMTWTVLEQSMPKPGYLGATWPTSGTPTLYAQKHNPFLYFEDIAGNANRLAHIIPLNESTLASTLANPPAFAYIVPDQCHDMHGTSTCSSFDGLLERGDDAVRSLVTTITSASSFTANSVLFVVWDEDDYSSKFGCCASRPGNGGGHTLAFAVDKNAAWRSASVPMNHYSLLKTIEVGLGLPLLGHTSEAGISDMFGLL